MKTTTLLFLSAAAFALAGTEFDAVRFKGRTDKANPLDYKVGEPIVFTLYTENLDEVPTNDTYSVAWKRTGDDGVTERGTSPFVIGDTCVVTTRLDRPGFVRLEANVVKSDGSRVQRTKKTPGCPDWAPNKEVFFDGGAGVETGKIRTVDPEPEDFDSYWAKQKELLKTVPVEAQYKPASGNEREGFSIRAVSVTCPGPRPVTGYLIVPTDAEAGSCTARLAVQGYGAYKQGVPWWAARKGEIFLEINAHGYDMEMPQEYYTEFFKGIATPPYSYAFSPEENADPDTAYFHGMVLRVLRALEFLKSLPEWNGKDLIVEGGSQGGLQTSWAAGLDHDVTLARPSITWGCDYGAARKDTPRLIGPWYIPFAKGLGYYDAVNHIKRATCPVEVTRAGLGDYTCPPSGLAAYYNAIKSEKSIRWIQGSQHGFIPLGENQEITLGEHAQTEGESQSQSASTDVAQ